jgi:ribosome-associated protein
MIWRLAGGGEPGALGARRVSRDYDSDALPSSLARSPSMPARPSESDASAVDHAPTETGSEPLRERPSKTRRKQESHDLQSLGEALLELPDEHVATLGLAEPLVDALRAARRIKSHEARRRHMQLIGKLMRSADVELARAAVLERQLGRARDSLALHQAERWRAELIAADDATTRFATAHPDADLQRLRALVRSARKDAASAPEQRSGRAYRELFQFIREHEVDG